MSTSTLTTNDICARVRARWSPLIGISLIPRADYNIALTIPGGCERLARAIKESADRALLVVEILNKSPTSGRIDLTHADYAGILIDTLRLPGAITTNAETSIVFKHAVSMDALRATTPTDTSCVWYHLRGKQLVFKHPSTGALNTYNVALNLAASYIPALGDATRPIPGELDDQLIDRIAEVVKELGGLQFLQMDPEMAGSKVAGV